MNTTTQARPLREGDQIHILDPHGALLFGYALRRGDELTVTQSQIDGQRGFDGKAWTDDLSEAAQLRRWGSVRIGLGPWPRDEEGNKIDVLIPGSVDWELARDRARREAYAQPVPRLRDAALRKFAEDFGAAPTTSQTVAGPSDPELRRQAAEERAKRLAEAANARPPRRVTDDQLADPMAVLDLGRAEALERVEVARDLLADLGTGA